jgi:hypothetical protein
LPLQIRRAKPEPVDPEINAFYGKLLPLVNEMVFHAGSFQLKTTFPDREDTFANLIAYTWVLGKAARLVIVNLSEFPSCGRIPIQDDLSESQTYVFTDRLSGQSFVAAGKSLAHPGMSFDLKSYQAQVWEIEEGSGRA